MKHENLNISRRHIEAYEKQMDHQNRDIDYNGQLSAADNFMKQLIFWILVLLSFVIVLSAGMLIINWSIHTSL